jgi:hypothetical protein
LQTRQMAGYDHEKVLTSFNIPEEYELGVYIAVGYPGDTETLPEKLKEREEEPRKRYRQQVFVRNDFQL